MYSLSNVRYSKRWQLLDNFASNQIDFYFNYWNTKSEIENDEKLEPAYKLLDLYAMDQGVSVLVTNYIYINNDYKACRIYQFLPDENNKPIAAKAWIYLALEQKTIEINIIDWRYFRDKDLKQQILTKMSWKEKDVFEGIFLSNNIDNMPSLFYLIKILYNICEMSNINDRNHELINIIYSLETSQDLEYKQLANLAIKITDDKFGVLLSQIKKANSEEDLFEIKKEFMNKDISKWFSIKDEMYYWRNTFNDFAGIPRDQEKINVNDTNKVSLFTKKVNSEYVNTAEKRFYQSRKRFFNEYKKAFPDSKAEFIFNSVTEIKFSNQDNLKNLNEGENE